MPGVNKKNVIIEKPNLRYEGKKLKVGDEIKMEADIAQEWIRAGMARIAIGKQGPGKTRKTKSGRIE